ncbi:MAG: YraN family protein [Chloroflexia bacterium]
MAGRARGRREVVLAASRADRRRLGRLGEAAAEAFLLQQGYEIVERNWRCRQGELDLVGRQGGDWVFIEVRSRRSSTCGSAEESVTPAKQRRLLGLAEAYLQAHGLEGVSWRIDVVAVEVDRIGRPARITLLPAAVWAQGGEV